MTLVVPAFMIVSLIVVFMLTLRLIPKSSFPPGAAARPIEPQPDDGVMRLRDIRIEDVRNGLNWRLIDPLEMTDEGWSLVDAHIEQSEEFCEDDYAAYSGLAVYENGDVEPIIMVREFNNCGYGGDYLEYVDRKWRQLGLVPSPNAMRSTEYIANPPAMDKSFDSLDNATDDCRATHRAGFRKWVADLKPDNK